MTTFPGCSSYRLRRAGAISGRPRRRHAEEIVLDRVDPARPELVVDVEAAPDVLRLPRRALHLIADEVRVRVLHALAVLVDRVAEVLRLADGEDLRGRVELVGDGRLHALRELRRAGRDLR